MADEKYGIKASKEVIMFVMGMIKALGEVFADGKVNFWDLFKFCKPMWLLVPVIKDFGELRNELSDLSADEKKELCDLVASELVLDNKFIEEHIEMVLQMGIMMIDLIPFGKALKAG